MIPIGAVPEEDLPEGLATTLSEEGYVIQDPAERVTMPAGLAAKVSQIMAESGYIKKAGRNQAQKYTFLSEEQLVDRLRKLMVAHKVLMIPSIKEVNTQLIDRPPKTFGNSKPTEQTPFVYVTVVAEYCLLDAETGEGFRFGAVGAGIDTQDKAVYKAQTGMNKYALMKAFQIPSGDDPEDDSDWGPVDPPLGSDGAVPFKKKIDGATRAFYSASEKAEHDALQRGCDAEDVARIYNRVLGSSGVEKIDEITESAARRKFITELTEALAQLKEE